MPSCGKLSSHLIGERSCFIACAIRVLPSQSRINRAETSAYASVKLSFSSAAVSDAVRDYVKTQVLEEVTKPDSRLWNDGALSRNGCHKDHDRTGKFNNSGKNESVQQRKGSGGALINGTTRNIPIDSLNEWHLDETLIRRPYDVPDGVRPAPLADPFELTRSEISLLSEGIRRDLIGTDHPVLNRAAAYFFEDGSGGKMVRPVMVMLISLAMEKCRDHAYPAWQRTDLVESQRRLAQISEMIHTASLFHDDVIDNSDIRRNKPAVHKAFGNKMAILAGDFLLARASIYLARLRNVEVVETMSTIIEHLVRGEVMQMKTPKNFNTSSSTLAKEQLKYYLRKSYYKTASLMANSCQSAALLGNYDDPILSAAYRYGKHVGLAFQLVDDVLDFEGDAQQMGKPALADLNAGIATAPVLFAAEEFPVLQELIQRKFKEGNDVEEAMSIVSASNGIERAKNLAGVHAKYAVEAVMELQASPYRDGLVHLAHKIVVRTG